MHWTLRRTHTDTQTHRHTDITVQHVDPSLLATTNFNLSKVMAENSPNASQTRNALCASHEPNPALCRSSLSK